MESRIRIIEHNVHGSTTIDQFQKECNQLLDHGYKLRQFKYIESRGCYSALFQQKERKHHESPEPTYMIPTEIAKTEYLHPAIDETEKLIQNTEDHTTKQQLRKIHRRLINIEEQIDETNAINMERFAKPIQPY